MLSQITGAESQVSGIQEIMELERLGNWGSKLVLTSEILPNFLFFKVNSSLSNSSSYMATSSHSCPLHPFHLPWRTGWRTSTWPPPCASPLAASPALAALQLLFLGQMLGSASKAFCRDTLVSIEFHDTLLSDSLLHLLHLLTLLVWLLPQVHGTHCLPNIGVRLFRIF